MPHLAAAAINAWLAQHGAVPATQPVLDATQRSIISPALTSDAEGLFYSALLTVADALNGATSGYFSWATVKLYYSSFYACRALLAMNDVAIFYPSKPPHSLKIVAGQSPKKEKGNTHKVVWTVLADQLPSSPLLGSIGMQSASDWFIEQREGANYRNPRFPDPTIPPQFASIDSLGLGRAVAAYVADTSLLYAFDPDHAVCAFPIECVRAAGAALKRRGSALSPADVTHIEDCFQSVGVDPAGLRALWT